MIVRTKLLTVTVEYEGSTFTLAELGTEEEATIAVSSLKSTGSALRLKFNKALISWTNVSDEKGPIECNDENKDIVFQANQFVWINQLIHHYQKDSVPVDNRRFE